MTLPARLEALTALGLCVFPLIANGKLPAIKAWPAKATLDPEEAATLFRAEDQNIGAATAGLLVLDVDTKAGKAGAASFAELDLLHGTQDWTATLTARTASGGLHLYFRLPPGAQVRNSSGKLGPGLDVRGLGGFVVAPGSTIDGRPYEWVNELPIAPAPLWLVELAGATATVERGTDHQAIGPLDSPGTLERARRLLRDQDPAIEGSGGDAHTFATAAKVKDLGVSELACLELMAEEWNGRCEPPWPFEDLAQKIANAYTYGKSAIGYKNPENDFGPVSEGTTLAPTSPSAFGDDEEIPEREWLVEGLIPLLESTLLTGDGGVGKTNLIMQIATAIALGLPIFGRKTRRGRVLLLLSEDDLLELRRRQRAINRALGVSNRDLSPTDYAWLSANDLGGRNTVILQFPPSNPSGAKGPFFAELFSLIARWQPDAVILDPLAAFFGGNEIDRQQVQMFSTFILRRMINEYRTTPIVLAHPSIAGMKERSGRSGSTQWANAVRSRLFLERPENAGDRNLRLLRTTKANYASLDQEILVEWEAGAFKLLAADADLPPAERHKVRFMRALVVVNGQGGWVSNSAHAANYAPRRLLGMPETAGSSLSELKGAMESLLGAGWVKASPEKRGGHERAVLTVTPQAPESFRPPAERPFTD